MVKEVKPKKVVNKKPKVKANNVGKVAKVLVKNPNATRREIESKTKLHPLTIQKAKEELNQNGTKDETIAYIVGSAKTRLQRISLLKDRYIDQLELAEEIGTKEIDMSNKLSQEDVKLVTVLGGNVTDEQGGLIKQDFSLLTDDQLDELLNK